MGELRLGRIVTRTKGRGTKRQGTDFTNASCVSLSTKDPLWTSILFYEYLCDHLTDLNDLIVSIYRKYIRTSFTKKHFVKIVC